MTKQFSSVNTAYGSPMGRSAYGDATATTARTVRVFKVRLIAGYDDGGAYWGCNMPGAYLYCATDGADYRRFVRARSRHAAIERLCVPIESLIVR